MSKKETNIFLIWTEYHFFVTVSTIVSNYSDDSTYNNIILHPASSKESRIPQGELSGLNANLIRLECDDFELKIYPELLPTLKLILNNNVALFVTFFEMKPLVFYLVNKLKGKAKICLAPDGNKPYLNWSRMSFIYFLKKTIKMNLYLALNRLWVRKLYTMSMIYGSLKELDEIWLTNTEKFKNHFGKKLRRIEVFDSPTSVDVVSKFYNFEYENLDIPSYNVIFYCNNNYYNEDAYKVELDILGEISRRYNDKIIAIKPHPLTPKLQLEQFNSLRNIKILKEKVPAELIISNLKESLVLSFWSAALMLNNRSCKFYWLHPIMRKYEVLESNLNIVNPTHHIIEVDSIDKINF